MKSPNNGIRCPRSVTLLIPTLNEIRGLEAVMPRIDRDWVEQILFVDGNSVDPGAELRISSKAPCGSKNMDEGLLKCVPGRFLFLENPESSSIDSSSELVE